MVRRPFRYTYLSDRDITLSTAWDWAKKLVTDLNQREEEAAAATTPPAAGDITNVTEVTEIIEGDAALTILVTDPNGDALTVGDGKACIPVDATLNGRYIKDVSARVTTASSAGSVVVMLRRVRGLAAQDLLLAAATIEVNEKSTTQAVLLPDVDGGVAQVETDDENWIDIDSAGTGAKGLSVTVVYGDPS